MGEKLTAARRKALEWIRAREPIGRFDATGPALWFVRKLEKEGLIEIAGREPGMFGFTKYALSAAGRRALDAAGE